MRRGLPRLGVGWCILESGEELLRKISGLRRVGFFASHGGGGSWG